jgi:hypothetical protein
MLTRHAPLARLRRGPDTTAGPVRGGDPTGNPVWPIAVGVVLAPAGFTGRTRAEDRLALALGAYRIGFFLLDLIDVPAWESADQARAWAPVWDLVLRTHADAVVVHDREASPLPRPPMALRRLSIRVLEPAVAVI